MEGGRTPFFSNCRKGLSSSLAGKGKAHNFFFDNPPPHHTLWCSISFLPQPPPVLSVPQCHKTPHTTSCLSNLFKAATPHLSYNTYKRSIMSEQSSTTTNTPSEPRLCKMGCGFFVSSKYTLTLTDFFREPCHSAIGWIEPAVPQRTTVSVCLPSIPFTACYTSVVDCTGATGVWVVGGVNCTAS